MKSFIMTAALLLAAPVSIAGEILPNLYAREYCSLRSMGVSVDEARAAAVEVAYLNNNTEVAKVTIDGKQYDVDVVRAYRAVSQRCPQSL
jgi:hypothetical protein